MVIKKYCLIVVKYAKFTFDLYVVSHLLLRKEKEVYVFTYYKKKKNELVSGNSDQQKV